MSGWPKHVLMTADTVGGVWTFALELANALEKRGVEVTLATSGARLTAEQRAQAKDAGDPPLMESTYKLEWQENAWDDVDRMGGWLESIAEKARPDVLHLNDYSHAARGWSVPVIVTGHSCVLSWFDAVRGTSAPRQWDEYRTRVTRGVHSADVVTAPSRAMLHCLEAHHGRIARAVVIPNGRTAALFSRGRKEPFVLASGRAWDEAKNIRALSQAAGQLAWPVYVAGSQQGALFENIIELGFLGREDLAGWMSRASIYCLPGRYEPFGLSILEAALSGCALVLGDIESLREIWGGCALFADPEDPAGIRQAVERLIKNPELRNMFAAKARKRARHFTPDAMAAGYLMAYSMARSARQVAA